MCEFAMTLGEPGRFLAFSHDARDSRWMASEKSDARAPERTEPAVAILSIADPKMTEVGVLHTLRMALSVDAATTDAFPCLINALGAVTLYTRNVNGCTRYVLCQIRLQYIARAMLRIGPEPWEHDRGDSGGHRRLKAMRIKLCLEWAWHSHRRREQRLAPTLMRLCC